MKRFNRCLHTPWYLLSFVYPFLVSKGGRHISFWNSSGFLASASVLYVGYANASTSAYATDQVSILLATYFDQEDMGCPFHHWISQLVPFLIFEACEKDKIRQASGCAATGLIQRNRQTRKWHRSLDLFYSNSFNQAMLFPIDRRVWLPSTGNAISLFAISLLLG